MPYVKSLNGCFVLHYTGGLGCRPWVRADVPLADVFWRYAESTLFFEMLNFQLLCNEMKKINTPRSKKRIFVFGIPFVTIEYKCYRTTAKLFGFLPLLVIRNKG